MPKSEKGEIFQPNIYRILPKVNQVIYTLDAICEPNIMILAQAVLQIFVYYAKVKKYRTRGTLVLFCSPECWIKTNLEI